MDNGLVSVQVNAKKECEHRNWFIRPQLPALVFTSHTAMSVLEGK